MMVMKLITRTATRDPLLVDVFGLSNRISRLLNDGFGTWDWQLGNGASASWVPAVDVLEEADAIRITAEIPGVNPSDVKISLENNVLTIQGSKQQTAEERAERVHR